MNLPKKFSRKVNHFCQSAFQANRFEHSFEHMFQLIFISKLKFVCAFIYFLFLSEPKFDSKHKNSFVAMNLQNWTQTEETFKTNIYNDDNCAQCFVWLNICQILISAHLLMDFYLYFLRSFVCLFKNTQNTFIAVKLPPRMTNRCMLIKKKQKPVSPGSRKR